MITSAKKSEVLAVPAPAFTATWHPYSHGQVIQTLDNVLEELAIPVVHEHYTVTNKGKRLFGSYTLDIANGGLRYELGFRNATDKSMALGFVAGTHVTVCSNMMFSGEFIELRKHTSGLTTATMFQLVKDAAGGAIEQISELKTWHMSLQQHPVESDQFKAITFDFLKAGVVLPTQFSTFLTCADEELECAGSQVHTLYSVHGGVTRMLRNAGMHRIQNVSASLNTVINQYL